MGKYIHPPSPLPELGAYSQREKWNEKKTGNSYNNYIGAGKCVVHKSLAYTVGSSEFIP